MTGEHPSRCPNHSAGSPATRLGLRISAASVQASPLARILAAQAGVETDRAGRIPVELDCTLPGHAEVFAIGDMVSLSGLPGVAQPATQEGKYVAVVIKARLDGAPHPGPFRYFDKGSMATIGYRPAVADAFGVRVTGLLAYLMWAVIHVAYLVGWGNRPRCRRPPRPTGRADREKQPDEDARSRRGLGRFPPGPHRARL